MLAKLSTLPLLSCHGHTFDCRPVGAGWGLRNREVALRKVWAHVTMVLGHWFRVCEPESAAIKLDKRAVPVLCFFAASGIGKTRMLLETRGLCERILLEPGYGG